MRSVCISSILYTLEGQHPENNNYCHIFLLWLSQLLSIEFLRSSDKIVIQMDSSTYKFISTNRIYCKLIDNYPIPIEILIKSVPKSHTEGFFWKYCPIEFDQDIFFYCDIDIFICKSLHTFLESVNSSSICVQVEGPLKWEYFNQSFTKEELQQIPDEAAGMSAGKFIIHGKQTYIDFLSILQQNISQYIDTHNLLYFEQSLFNRSIHEALRLGVNINTSLLKFPEVCMRYGVYDKEKTALLDFAGNAGDGLRHYNDMMEAFILLHSNAL